MEKIADVNAESNDEVTGSERTAETVERIRMEAGASPRQAAEPRRDGQLANGVPRGYTGAKSEVAQIKSVLWTKAATPTRWVDVAGSLMRFFGTGNHETAGVGYKLFLQWTEECRPKTDKDDADAIQTWVDVKSYIEEQQRDGAETELETLSGTIASINVFCDSHILWPVLHRDGKTAGAPVATSQVNIRHFLGHLRVTVWKNDFSLRYLVEGLGDFDELNDEAMRALHMKAHALGLKTPRPFFQDVVLNIARENVRHPVREYLKQLEDGKRWDGKPRIDSCLIDYAGAENTELNKAFGRLFLLAAVRRVRRPGVKFDFLLVLEGQQGLGKSSLARALAGPEWFEDALELGASPKHTVEQMGGKRVGEFSELSGITRREVETVKASLSRTHDTARLAYDKTSSTVPRQFILIIAMRGRRTRARLPQPPRDFGIPRRGMG
jgi:Virulence-associated protein E